MCKNRKGKYSGSDHLVQGLEFWIYEYDQGLFDADASSVLRHSDSEMETKTLID